MVLKPISLKAANLFVLENHDHNGPVIGHKFSIGLMAGDKMIGVAIVGRPSAPKLDDEYTAEVTRLCVLRNNPNACSKLYAACARITKEMGYVKIVTFTLMSETGISLKASGWVLEAENCGGKGKFNKSAERQNKRPVYKEDLFGKIEEIKYPDEFKKRWVKPLTAVKVIDTKEENTKI